MMMGLIACGMIKTFCHINFHSCIQHWLVGSVLAILAAGQLGSATLLFQGSASANDNTSKSAHSHADQKNQEEGVFLLNNREDRIHEFYKVRLPRRTDQILLSPFDHLKAPGHGPQVR